MDTNTTLIVLTALITVFAAGVYANQVRDFNRKYRKAPRFFG